MTETAAQRFAREQHARRVAELGEHRVEDWESIIAEQPLTPDRAFSLMHDAFNMGRPPAGRWTEAIPDDVLEDLAALAITVHNLAHAHGVGIPQRYMEACTRIRYAAEAEQANREDARVDQQR